MLMTIPPLGTYPKIYIHVHRSATQLYTQSLDLRYWAKLWAPPPVNYKSHSAPNLPIYHDLRSLMHRLLLQSGPRSE